MSTTFVPPKPDQWEGPSQKFVPPPVESWQGPANASVPGMELLGGAPAPAPAPPNALRPSIPMTNREGQITDTGANMPMGTAAKIAMAPLAVGKALFESSGRNVTQGVKRMNAGARSRSPFNPIPSSEELGGMSDLARGIGEAALPIAAATNPVGTAIGIATGAPTSMAVEGTANALGAPKGTSQFLGDAAGFGVGAKAPELVSDLASGAKNIAADAFASEPKTSMVKAMKPTSTNTGFKASLDRSLPELKATEVDTGKPIESLPDLMSAIETAKKRVWQQYRNIAEQPAVDPYSGKPTVGTMADAQYDMSPVADAMESTISPKLLRENPLAVKSIKSLAAKYRTSMTLQEAESILKSTNAELDGYYAKYPTGQRTALAANPQVAVKEAQASALRDTIYSALDAAGEGAAPREFKQRYGALMNLEREGYRRMNVADRQQPDNLSEQVGKWSGMGRIVKGALTMNPADVAMGIAESKTAKWLKEQQTTDALIKSAMSRYKGTPSPVETPAPFQPKALIGKGDIITPPPADTSYVRSVPAMVQPPNPQRAITQGDIIPPSDFSEPVFGPVQGHYANAPNPRRALPPAGTIISPKYPPPDAPAADAVRQVPPAMEGSFARGVNAPLNPKTGKPWTAEEIKSYLASLPHHSKGGIIRKPTVLSDLKTGEPTGIMAESGPEAIVPLGAPPHVRIGGTPALHMATPPEVRLHPLEVHHPRSAKQRGAIFEAERRRKGNVPPGVRLGIR